MFGLILPLADFACVAVLVLALYYPRHRRRDLVAAFLSVNVGVLAVAAALAATSVNVGLGLGLFGVLALIRLRSAELRQHEIAYYFASLALGLIGGLAAPMGWVAVTFMAAIVLVLGLADWRGAARANRVQVVVLPGLHPAGPELDRQVAALFGSAAISVAVRKLDVVTNRTTIAVRTADVVSSADVAPAPQPIPPIAPLPTAAASPAGRAAPPGAGQDEGIAHDLA
ncbi:MAG: DUF4956 domain-containing protein [Bifidobacteriaceae bacterium]|nr:DUF4956 domain-containing protein [Bifidobacteriaceae bacterium]